MKIGDDATPKIIDLDKSLEGLDRVYCCVCENPGESMNEMAEELEMPHENVEIVLKELKSAGLVEFELAQNSPVAKKVYPVDIDSLIPAKLRKELAKLIDEE